VMPRRKGSVQDGLRIVGGALAAGIGLMVALALFMRFQGTALLPAWVQNPASSAFAVFDAGIVIVFTGFYIVAGALAFQIRTSKLFAIPAFLLNVFAVWLAATVSNTFNTVASAVPFLSNAANQLPILVTLMNQLPLVVGILQFLVLTVLTFMTPTKRTRVGL